MITGNKYIGIENMRHVIGEMMPNAVIFKVFFKKEGHHGDDCRSVNVSLESLTRRHV